MSHADRLVGREPVMAAARAVLADAAAGSGQLLVVSGEAGIGKTAVLAALIDEAGPDARVLRGFCVEGSGVPPYWPWSQVLRATGVPAAELGEASWLLAAGTSEATTAAAAADAQFRLFDAVARCLATLAADSLVVVALDDLQWADESSVRLLGFLARTLAATKVLLLGAFRDAEAPPELAQLASTAQQLTLVGLGAGDVDAMVSSMLASSSGPKPSPAVMRQLWQRSGGNPFFVRELTRLLIAQDAWHERTQIPASVTETLRRRLARLSTACVRLLEWAAVAGRDIDPGLLSHSDVGERRSRPGRPAGRGPPRRGPRRRVRAALHPRPVSRDHPGRPEPVDEHGDQPGGGASVAAAARGCGPGGGAPAGRRRAGAARGDGVLVAGGPRCDGAARPRRRLRSLPPGPPAHRPNTTTVRGPES